MPASRRREMSTTIALTKKAVRLLELCEAEGFQTEARLAEIRKNLAPLESGQMRIGERTGGGPWRDITADWIAQDKRTIGIYEAILAALQKRELG
jgi:hypothetical protein